MTYGPVQGLGNLLYMQRCKAWVGGGGLAGCKGRLDMWRVGLAVVALLTTVGAAHAQFWGSPYGSGGYYQRPQPGLYSPFFGWD